MSIKTTFVTIACCAGILLAGCNQKSDSSNVTKSENTKTDTLAIATLPPIVASSPVSALTFTPTHMPVERKDVRFIGLKIGTALDKKNEINNPTSSYKSSDSIYAIVSIYGSGPDATIKLRCTDEDKNVVYEESKTITPKGLTTTIPFTVVADKKLPAGSYRIEGLLDEWPGMAVRFEVAK